MRGKVHEYGIAGGRSRLLTKDNTEPQHVSVYKKFSKFKFETKHPQGHTISEPAFMTMVTPLGKLYAFQFDAKDKEMWMAIFNPDHNNTKPAETTAPVRMRAPTVLQPNIASAAVPPALISTIPAATVPAVASVGAISSDKTHRATKSRSGKREGGIQTSDDTSRKRKTTKVSGSSSKSSHRSSRRVTTDEASDLNDATSKDKKKTISRTKKPHRDSTRELSRRPSSRTHSHRSSKRVTADETSELNEQTQKEEKYQQEEEKEKQGSSSSSTEETEVVEATEAIEKTPAPGSSLPRVCQFSYKNLHQVGPVSPTKSKVEPQQKEVERYAATEFIMTLCDENGQKLPDSVPTVFLSFSFA